MATTAAVDIRTGDVTREYGRIVKAARTMSGMQIRYVQDGRRRQATLALCRKLTIVRYAL